MGSVDTSNILNPKKDGVTNPRDRIYKTSFSHSRQLSPVFTEGPCFEEVVSPMLVDRNGLNASATIPEIINRDEKKQVSATRLLLLPNGVKNVRNRIFKTSFFNSRRGLGFEEVVPPMLVDRDCLEANITENIARQSKFTYALMLKKIITRDEIKQVSETRLVLSPNGVKNLRNRIFKTSFFNSRKHSPVFTRGPGFKEVVPPMFVDRNCLKATITENLTRQSEFTYGVMLEEIITRDETRRVSTNGLLLSSNGGIRVNGPPTSGTGIDRIASLQANITCDNTKLVNGAIVGEKNVFQVDQGLGKGSNFTLFNRHQITLTRFIQLKRVEEGSGNPQPPVLVLHGHYGGYIGDFSSYDAFVLGGPNSVRGYSMGELGAARNILELGAEIRIPVKNTHVYAFAEHGNDLGSSKDVKGNPTAVYRKMGHGSSYGFGVKLGQVRAEYTVGHNRGTGALFLRFGERY